MKNTNNNTNIFSHLNSSAWLLILSNIFTLYLAISQKWSLSSLLWIYWAQSIIIGIFAFINILTVKPTSTEIKGKKKLRPKKGANIFLGIFFIFHYGFLHFVYFSFLVFISSKEMFTNHTKINIEEMSHNFTLIFLAIVIFFTNHLFSYFKNKNTILIKSFLSPYGRIIPMHLIIIIGFIFNPNIYGVIIFISLKTIIDFISHQTKHYIKTN